MASTYSPNLRLELIGTGEQQGTWGTTTNTNLGTLLEEAIGGYVSVPVTDGADTVLTTANGGADQSRNMTINLSGALTGARNVICPAIEKLYVVKNSTTGGFAVTFKVFGQTGVTIANGQTAILFVDGTDARPATSAITSSGLVPITAGGTGASTASSAATNLGLGTGDSPQFTAVNIGNATDTTITRSSAGVIAVEGGIVPLENRTNTFSANQIIEVTDNTNAALRVTQLGTGNAILVEDSTNPDSTPFVVTADGTVGIGTNSIGTATKVEIRGPNSITNARGTLAINTTNTAATDLGGSITLGGENGQATTPFVFAQIAGRYEGTGYAGYLQFATTVSGSGAITERMRITSSGNVGIGTVVPDALFSVNGIASFGAGAASTPSIAAFGDLNTGMWYPAADTIAWSTGGSERMRIRSDGNVVIGGTGNAAASLSIQKSITGGTFAFGASVEATIQSDVTNGFGFNTFLITAAASFSVNLSHYRTSQGTFGAGSTVNIQYGFHSTGSLIGATSNAGFAASDTSAVTTGKTAYGFLSGINTATGGGTTYGFYAAGTAPNYFAGQVQLAAGSAGTPSLSASGDTNTGMWYPAADTIAWSTGGSERMRIGTTGNVGIGGTGSAVVSLSIQKAITGGTTAVGADVAATVQSDVTTTALGYNTTLATQATTFTTNIQHYRATQGTFGASSTVTTQYGFNSTGSLIGATTNYGFFSSDTAAVTTGKTAYGFYSAINTATGGGTTYGFYAAGTARNLFSGDVQVFGAGGLGYTTGSGGAVTQGTSRTTGVTLDKTNGAITLFSAAGTTTWQSFTVTNSTVAATDTIIVCQKSGTDLYELHVTAVSAGSFRISFRTTGGTTTEQPVFNFAVIKAVTA